MDEAQLKVGGLGDLDAAKADHQLAVQISQLPLREWLSREPSRVRPLAMTKGWHPGSNALPPPNVKIGGGSSRVDVEAPRIVVNGEIAIGRVSANQDASHSEFGLMPLRGVVCEQRVAGCQRRWQDSAGSETTNRELPHDDVS